MEPSRNPRAAASEEPTRPHKGGNAPAPRVSPTSRRLGRPGVATVSSRLPVQIISPPPLASPALPLARPRLRLVAAQPALSHEQPTPVSSPGNISGKLFFIVVSNGGEGGGGCQIVRSIDRRRDAARELRGKHDGASAEVIGFPAGYEPGRGSDRRTSSRHRGTGLHILTRPAEDAQARSCRCPHGSK